MDSLEKVIQDCTFSGCGDVSEALSHVGPWIDQWVEQGVDVYYLFFGKTKQEEQEDEKEYVWIIRKQKDIFVIKYEKNVKTAVAMVPGDNEPAYGPEFLLGFVDGENHYVYNTGSNLNSKTGFLRIRRLKGTDFQQIWKDKPNLKVTPESVDAELNLSYTVKVREGAESYKDFDDGPIATGIEKYHEIDHLWTAEISHTGNNIQDRVFTIAYEHFLNQIKFAEADRRKKMNGQ